ncbi:hypothetical protein ACWEVD_31800 [Nocardia thailandica]
MVDILPARTKSSQIRNQPNRGQSQLTEQSISAGPVVAALNAEERQLLHWRYFTGLLQNTQDRADAATQHKLNAIAGGLADLMTALGDQRPGLHHDVKELRDAVGLEDHEGSG